jgi:phenylacetate-CoA ligase
VPRVEAVPIHASSATTGRPTVVGYAKRDVEIWAEVCARSIRAAGGRPGDLVHVVYGYGLFIAASPAHPPAQPFSRTGGIEPHGTTSRSADRGWSRRVFLIPSCC